MGATATVRTDSIVAVEKALDDGYSDRPAAWIPSPDLMLNDAIGNWVLGVQEAFWPRHHCSPEITEDCDGDSSCPGAPAWERDLSRAYRDTCHSIEEDAKELARDALRLMVRRFATEHPEALRAEREAAA